MHLCGPNAQSGFATGQKRKSLGTKASSRARKTAWRLPQVFLPFFATGTISALAEAELPVICVEMRHMQAVLKAQINKTDRNDARGIAQMMRVVIGDIRNVTGHCAWLVLSCSISCSTVPAREAPWRLAALGINSRSHVSSSSSFFASFRSAVSNPSVNQPYTGASTSRASVRRPVRPIDVRDYF